MKERWSMKALGDQAVGLGNNSVKGMIKTILDRTSHVPNSGALQLPSLCLECRGPPSLSVLLLFVIVQMSPPLSPVPLEMLLAAIMWSPKLFTLVLEFLCMCLTPP